MAQAPFVIGGTEVPPGSRTSVEIQVPPLYTHTSINIPVHVIHGRRAGPRLFLSAALHGDEINGVEIIRRVLRRKSVNRVHGTLIAVPVVNVYGFINQSRYLPDRRDLNRVFPGSERGSLAARLAYAFLNGVAGLATHGIDLHTGAIHRENLPQIRAYMDDEETARLAHAFPTPVILNSEPIEGSLRKTLMEMGIPVIVYEASEALRFDEVAVRAGVDGVMSAMQELGMLPRRKRRDRGIKSLVARSSAWVRAPQSGLLRTMTRLGARVAKGDVLGIVSDPFGETEAPVTAGTAGIIIGRSNIPLVNAGEALFHVARFSDTGEVAGQMEVFQHEMDPATDMAEPDEQPIV